MQEDLEQAEALDSEITKSVDQKTLRSAKSKISEMKEKSDSRKKDLVNAKTKMTKFSELVQKYDVESKEISNWIEGMEKDLDASEPVRKDTGSIKEELAKLQVSLFMQTGLNIM